MDWNSTSASYVSSSSSDFTALLRPLGFGPGRALICCYRIKNADPEGPAKARATRPETRAQEEIMTAANSAGKPRGWRLLRLRTRGRAVRRGACSCGHLPTEHAQRVRLDFFFVLDYRQPIGIFVHRPIAGRALPDDLQASILDFEAPAQIGAGNSNIAVRDIAFRAGRACGASSNGSAKTVPVWLSCGLHAGCATEGGAHAACSRELRSTAQSTSGRMSSQRTAPFVARSMAGQRSAGTGLIPLHHWLMRTGVMPSLLARSDAGPFVEMYVRRSIAHTLAQR